MVEGCSAYCGAQFEAMVETIRLLVFSLESYHARVSERWCEMDLATIRIDREAKRKPSSLGDPELEKRIWFKESRRRPKHFGAPQTLL